MSDVRRLILCEGDEDVSFLRHFLSSRGIAGFDVDRPKPGEAAGSGAFQRRLEVLVAATALDAKDFRIEDLQELIVVADNDDDPASAFRNVRTQIRDAGYGDPQRPRDPVRAADRPQTRILMLPWDDERGGLETLCLAAVLDARPYLRECVDEYVRCTKFSRADSIKGAKMRLRCSLSAACEQEPNVALTYVWNDRHRELNLVPLDHSCFDRIEEFFRGL